MGKVSELQRPERLRSSWVKISPPRAKHEDECWATISESSSVRSGQFLIQLLVLPPLVGSPAVDQRSKKPTLNVALVAS